MKKEIERAAHVPTKQQNWTGLYGAKDSVLFEMNIFLSLIEFYFRMNYKIHPLLVKLILLYVKQNHHQIHKHQQLNEIQK
jgi:hypothetical protein